MRFTDVGISRSDAAHDRVGLDTDRAQRGHRVLGRLGLQLTGRREVGHQRHVQEEDVVAAHVVADLACGLEERQRLDVADGAADLGDHHVDVGAGHGPDPLLDLVGDVRDHLDGVAEVVAAALLGDHPGVDLPGRDVGDLAQVGVEEALVVTDVEVGLPTVVGDEHLAVLERVHRSRVDVEVRVQLLHGDPQPTCLEKVPEARGREALAEGGGDASGDEDVLGWLRCGQGNSRGVGAGPRWIDQRRGGWKSNRPRGSRLPTTQGRLTKAAPGVRTCVGTVSLRGLAGHHAVGGVDGAVVARPPGRLLGECHHRDDLACGTVEACRRSRPPGP